MSQIESQNIGWSNIINKDVIAAVDAIKRFTRADKIFWLGHGLGGLMLYSLLSIGGERDIAGGISIDAPALFTPHRLPLPLKIIQKIWNQERVFPSKIFAQLYAQIDSNILGSVSPEQKRGILYHCCENISSGLSTEIADWLETGRFCTNDQHHLSTLRGVKTPLLFCSGNDAERSTYVSYTSQYFLNPSIVKGSWNAFPFWEESSPLIESIESWTKDKKDACWGYE